jgi:hypothetical protein
MSVVSLPSQILYHLLTKDQGVLINDDFSMAQARSGQFEIRDRQGEVCISGRYGGCLEEAVDYYFHCDLFPCILRLCEKHNY